LSTIQFAIIGCGRIAQRHAEHIHNLAHLAAVCDIKRQRADELAAKYNCRSYAAIDDLLAKEPKIDVVSICTPNWLHAEHTIKGLKAGKHVLCEKPMALRVADCRRMIEESERNRKLLFVVKQNRFNPPVAALKKALDDGRLGRIVNVQLNCFWNRTDAYYRESDWKGTLDLDGGTLFTQFSHFIDLLIWMIGDIETLHVLTENSLHQSTIQFEDTGVIALRFTNGALGTINYTVNSHQKNMEGSITVFGEKGTVKIGGQYLNALEYQCIEGYEITNVQHSAPANDYGFYQGSMSNHDKVYQNVIDVLTRNHAIATSGLEGLKTVEVIERIYAQANIAPGT
jgi:UDP-N-acetyl-2-amino-2-deoxyglucuronate dehydrogenase